MNLADYYLWLKALHVAMALTFVGGALAVAVFLAAIPDDLAGVPPIARRIRRWNRAVTTPAVVLLWLLGITLVATGRWLAVGWLQAKLPVVLIITGLHAVQSGHLSQLADGARIVPIRPARLIVLCALTIALLAVAQPF